jgi:hypothetical protein
MADFEELKLSDMDANNLTEALAKAQGPILHCYESKPYTKV